MIEDYEIYKNFSYLERKYNINRKVIKKEFVKNNIPCRDIKQHKLNLTQDDINKIIDMFLNDVSMKVISKIYNCDEGTIRRILRDNEIDTSRKYYNFQKYKVNEFYFDNIDTEDKAYILGFIFADGCVHNNLLTITLHKKDINTLKTINNFMESNYPIYDIKNKYKRLDISNRFIAQRLKEIV